MGTSDKLLKRTKHYECEEGYMSEKKGSERDKVEIPDWRAALHREGLGLLRSVGPRVDDGID